MVEAGVVVIPNRSTILPQTAEMYFDRLAEVIEELRQEAELCQDSEISSLISDSVAATGPLSRLFRALADRKPRPLSAREAADRMLHPTGRCTCAGEGKYEWCLTHGAAADRAMTKGTDYSELDTKLRAMGRTLQEQPNATNATTGRLVELCLDGNSPPVGKRDQFFCEVARAIAKHLPDDINPYSIQALFPGGTDAHLAEKIQRARALKD